MATVTDEELLAAARSALAVRLSDGVEEYQFGGERFRYLSLDKLLAIVDRLESRINAGDGGGSFGTLVPTDG